MNIVQFFINFNKFNYVFQSIQLFFQKKNDNNLTSENLVIVNISLIMTLITGNDKTMIGSLNL